MPGPIITVDGVSKDFGDGPVLDGVDLEIYENETTVLMGPNGAGKTILLSCIAGGLFPSEGTIEVLGTPPADARSELSFLIQGGLGLPLLSGRENIAFYTDLHPGGTDRWRDIADRMELTDDLDRPVDEYSGGMVRKLELAITLAADVPLYLLDEPTAELDLTTIDTLHSLLAERQSEGHTVVLTSHTPLDVDLADRIVFVQHGRAVADGDPDELMAAVPPVVRVTGAADLVAVTDHVRDGQLFDTGNGRRGFLTERSTVDDVRAAVGEDSAVERDDPTYTDLFNYYTRIVPDR
jgi:ABC-type multidrug transport system ATPase subunit